MRLLTFNCHEAWVHQLGALNAELDIVVDLAGRYTKGWDEHMRPVPEGARLLTLSEALQQQHNYDCIIAHNITDLLDSKTLAFPKILVLHGTLEGRIANEQSTIPAAAFKQRLKQYTELQGVLVVAISEMKARSWGLDAETLYNGVDVDAYYHYDGSTAAGIRVANHISQRRDILMWDFHQQAFAGLPVTLVGHNPDLAGVSPSEDWSDLKRQLSSHRFYIHTADPHLEDGFNLAMLEAMAAGLPVLGNKHPTSIIVQGETGFVSDDPDELRAHAETLLADRELAAQMGARARDYVRENFALSDFASRMQAAVGKAREYFARRQDV